MTTTLIRDNCLISPVNPAKVLYLKGIWTFHLSRYLSRYLSLDLSHLLYLTKVSVVNKKMQLRIEKHDFLGENTCISLKNFVSLHRTKENARRRRIIL